MMQIQACRFLFVPGKHTTFESPDPTHIPSRFFFSYGAGSVYDPLVGRRENLLCGESPAFCYTELGEAGIEHRLKKLLPTTTPMIAPNMIPAITSENQ